MIHEARKAGLEIHPAKTKLIFNGIGRRGPANGYIKVDGKEVEILSDGTATMYLGRALDLQDVSNTEIKHRIAQAWAKFGVYRRELTEREYPLSSRMRLFNSIITPSVLYGCGAWTMTAEREALLRTAQRKMLRRVLASGRRRIEPSTASSTSYESAAEESDDDECQIESWVDWVKRVTTESQHHFLLAGGQDWVQEQRRRK